MGDWRVETGGRSGTFSDKKAAETAKFLCEAAYQAGCEDGRYEVDEPVVLVNTKNWPKTDMRG